MSMLFNDFDLDTQIACVNREIKMREKVYPRWVEQGRMKQAQADSELECMKSVCSSLHRLKGLEK